MGRASREIRLQERSARARLKVRHHPYWRMISEGRHIGYYRGPRGGRWFARYRATGSADDYVRISLGVADDGCEANGVTILNWKQALDKANEWIEQQANGGRMIDPNMTVRHAVNAYIKMRDERRSAQVGRPVRSTASYKLGAYALKDAALIDIKLRDLTELDLRNWQRRFTGLTGSSKQRVVSELKAALNSAFEENRQGLPKDLPVTIKFGLKPIFVEEAADQADARDNQILSDNQIRDILEKAQELDEDSDYALLAILLAATGARFSQLARMFVRDVQPQSRRLLVPPSRKGRGKKVSAHIRVQVGADIIEALRPAIEDRPFDAPLLERWRYKQTSPTNWERVARQPWKTPSEMTRWWNRVVEAAGLPGVIPYALRHSSIVRSIRMGLPIRLVAALHDTSVAMIEKHYSRWITEGLDELAARAVVPLLKAA
ncbi:integrase [Sphingomonas cavernae]|uniref:Integrase n=1 Tax=Sphingomonas cavernae TaxID=2320861 RepID=A0A418W7X0_9SPHN|nr:integrase [Sphingomonas cavernae]